MALGNEASTEPRIAKLEVSEQPWVRRIMADAGGLGRYRGRCRSCSMDPYGGGAIVQAELPKASMNLCAVALVKQDRENDLFHIFDLEDRSERSA